MALSNQTVTVYGAYGHTGRFVIAELCRRGWTPILSGRDADKLHAIAATYPGLEVRVASVDEAAPGTLVAGQVSRQRRDGSRVVFANGQLSQATGVAPTTDRTFPEPLGVQAVIAEFTMADTVTIARHLKTPEIRSYMTVSAVKDLTHPSPVPPTPSDASGRSAQTFVVEVVVRKGSEERRAVARGRDIYAFTAPLVVEAMERVIGGLVKAPGVYTAGEAFDARDFLAALCPAHLTVDTR